MLLQEADRMTVFENVANEIGHAKRHLVHAGGHTCGIQQRSRDGLLLKRA